MGRKQRPRIRAVPKKTVTLEFEDGDYVGGSVICAADLSLGAYLDFTKPATDGADAMEANLRLLKRFGKEVLLDWNFDDAEGNALPPTSEGILAIPMELASLIMTRWNEALAGVAGPLDTPSSDGEKAIPMEALASPPR